MLPSNDTLPHCGLDVYEDPKPVDSYSDTVTSDDEVMSTPYVHKWFISRSRPPSSPIPFPEIKKVIETCPAPPAPVDYSAMIQMRNNQLFAQYQQHMQQYQMLLQQKLFMSIQAPPMLPAQGVVPPTQWSPSVNIAETTQWSPSMTVTEGFSFESAPISQTYDLGAAHATKAEAYGKPSPTSFLTALVKLTPLDASYFGGAPNGSIPRLTTIPMDISGNLTDAQYSKIFKKYHQVLRLDAHPIVCF